MIKRRKRIEIVRSNIKGFSSMSQESAEAIHVAISKHYPTAKITTVDNLVDLERLVLRKPDLVFLGMESIPKSSVLGSKDSNRIWLSEYLEQNGIVYTGSDRSAHELQRNKHLAKRRLKSLKINTSPFIVIKNGSLPKRSDINLTYPLFVKPTDKGGGLGVDSNSIVYNFEQLSSKVRSIGVMFQADSLIEEFMPGREFSVAVLKDLNSPGFSVMPIELIAPKDKNGMRILSSKVKIANTERAVKLDDQELITNVSTLALDVFHGLGARDYGRIDIRLDKNGVPSFLEANLLPSLISGYGSFPKACMINLSLDYEQMILQIVKLGLSHTNTPVSEALTPTLLTDPNLKLVELIS